MSYNMRYWWNKGLDKKMQNKLKTGLYSYEEVDGIFQMVSNLYHARLKTFKRLTIFLMLMFLAMFIFNIINIEDKFIAVISVLVVCVFAFFVMLFAYFNWAVKERNQFIKCIKTGYPDLIAKFEFL